MNPPTPRGIFFTMETISYFLRFVLEVFSIFIFGYFGYSQFNNPWHVIAAIMLPAIAMGMWGVFNVPNDPSRGNHVVVKVPGWVRFMIEMFVFLGAGYCLFELGETTLSASFFILVFFQYITTYKRVIWLLKQ